MWMRPRRNVPVVRTTAPARISSPPAVRTPATRPAAPPGGAPGGIEAEILGGAGSHLEPRLVGKQARHRPPVDGAIGLGARPAHGRPLAPVEHPEVDAGAVDGASHEAVEGVDLAHQLALAQAADGRVARHLADGLQAVGEQEGAGAEARRRRRRLAAGVAAPDHDDVEALHGCTLGRRGRASQSGARQVPAKSPPAAAGGRRIEAPVQPRKSARKRAPAAPGRVLATRLTWPFCFT